MTLAEIADAAQRLRGELPSHERQHLLDQLQRTQPADAVVRGALRGVFAEEDRRAQARAAQQLYDAANAEVASKLQRDRERPQRWKALSPMAQALYFVADGITNFELQDALIRVAKRIGTDTTEIPDTFEREERYR